MVYKIAHFGDIQINLNSENTDRTIEYRSALLHAAKSVIANNADFVVIAGDIFERHITTDLERQLYVEFIHELLLKDANLHIIVIAGNHDIRKRNLEYFDGSGTAKQTTVLAEINAAINSNRYHYSNDAKILEFPGISFACWSELAKYDDNLHVSPYEALDYNALQQYKQNHMLIDVYHGTMHGAKDMGNVFEFEPDDITLHGHCAMLGHIHLYQQLGDAVYSSSLVQRSFNEGIRYDNDGLIYDYSNSHGYAIWTVNTDMQKYAVEHVPIWQSVQMVTFVINQYMTKSKLISLLKLHSNQSLSIKLVLDNPNAEALAFMYNFCKDNARYKIKKVEAMPKAKLPNEHADAETIELSVDAFTNIANTLLQPVINERYQSDKSYGKAVLNKAIDILKTECGYHLHPESRSKILLIRAVIDGFKTIGHAEINFMQHGLFAMHGQNGQGKTTCFEAIAFALTGQHNRTFKRNAKNKQFLRLFNDKQPENDVVKISIYVDIDGKVFCIQVMLQKFMNQDWTARNWQSCITKINKTLQIFEDDENGQLICSGDDADAWLMQRFGMYEDFVVLHLLDQSTLESIKYMQPDELSNFILQRLGYSVISKFQYYYQGCKNTEMQSTPNPTNKTYIQLCQDTEIYNAELSNANEQLVNKQLELTNYNAIAKNLSDKLYATIATKTTIPSQLIANWKEDTKYIDEAGIDVQLTALHAKYATITESIKQNADNNAKYAEISKQVKSAIENLVNSASNSLQLTIKQWQDKLQVAQNSFNAIVLANNDAKHAKQQLDMQLSNYETQSISITNAVNDLNKQLASIKPDTCPLCNGVIDADKLNAYKLDLQTKLAAYNAELEDIASKVMSLKAKDIVKQQDTTEFSKAINDINAELAALHAKNAKLADSTYQMAILHANDAELYDKFIAAEQIVNAITNTCVDDLVDIETNIHQLEKAKLAFEQLHAYDSALKANELIDITCQQIQADINVNQSHISDCQLVIDNLNNSIVKYKQYIETTAELKLKVVTYNISQEALGLYKWLIYDAMPQYLYAKVCNVINSYIAKQNLPDTIHPCLSEDCFGQVVLKDRMHDGSEISRPILEASGMEITIAGLVICLAIHEAKLAIDFPMILIDELSGKLSTGTDYDKTNYLEVFLQVLKHAAEHCQIMIVDHRLDADVFDSITDIVKDKVTNVSFTK